MGSVHDNILTINLSFDLGLEEYDFVIVGAGSGKQLQIFISFKLRVFL